MGSLRKEIDDMVTKETEQREKASVTQSISDQWSVFLSLGNLKPLLVCLVLQFVQQWCGVHVIMFKTVNVLKTFKTSIDHNLCGGGRLLHNILSVYLSF